MHYRERSLLTVNIRMIMQSLIKWLHESSPVASRLQVNVGQ